MIAGKEPLRKAVTFYVEFERGSLYFDRSGRLLRRWEKVFPGWAAPTVVGTQVTAVHIEREWVGEFRPNGMSLTLNTEMSAEAINEVAMPLFAAGCAALIGELVDEFELDRFSQLGYRETYQFPTDSLEESSQWIRRLGIAPIPPPVFAAFGNGYFALTSALVLFADDCRYRIEVKGMEGNAVISLGPAELAFRASNAKRLNTDQDKQLLSKLKKDRQRQLNPRTFGQVDLEAFLWDGVAIDYEVADFVNRHSTELLDKFRRCVSDTEIHNV